MKKYSIFYGLFSIIFILATIYFYSCEESEEVQVGWINASISKSSINFGTVAVGQTADQQLIIGNSSVSSGNLKGKVTISGAGFTVIDGGGSFNLAPGESISVKIRFSPISKTESSGSLTITHNATNNSSPKNVSLSGSGGSMSFTYSPASLDFGTIPVNQTSDQNLSFWNSGTTNLSGSVGISGVGFTIIDGGGSFNLTPGQSKTVTVKFSPTAAASYTGSLNIVVNEMNPAPMNIPLNGMGQGDAAPSISVSPSSINFGTITVGQTSDQNLTITNSGTANMTGSVSVSGTGFSLPSGSGSYTLTPGQSKTVTVRFSPTAATSYSGSVSITHNASNYGNPLAVPLTGTGKNSILIDVPTYPSNYGQVPVGQYKDQDFVVTNLNTSTANLTGNISVEGTGFSINSGENTFNLAPGQSKTFIIRFQPTAVASYTGTLTLTHNGTNAPSPATQSLSGTGISSTSVIATISPTSIDFGTVNIGQTVDRSFTVSNSASSNANLSGSISFSGPCFSIISGSGSFSLSPGQTKTVTVRYTPTTTAICTQLVYITHNATNITSPTTVTLRGTGQESSAPELTLSSTSISFGTITIGQTSDQNLTITNSGTANMTGSVSVSGTGFSLPSGSGSYTLTPGQSKIVTVRFAPTAATSYTGSVSISHNATNASNPFHVTLNGTGQSAEQIREIVVNFTTIDYGVVVAGQTLTRELKIANLPNSNSLLNGSVSISGTGFSIVSGGGAFSLAPGETQSVFVRFSPTQRTTYTGSITIIHNATNNGSPITVPLVGIGGPIEPLRVVNPNSTTVWGTGERDVQITWETGNLGGYVSIALYKGNSLVATITSSTVNDGYYTWDVPLLQAQGSDYRVLIRYDSYNYDYSDPFNIERIWAELNVSYESGALIPSTNVDKWKGQIYVNYNNQDLANIYDPSWSNCNGYVLILSPNAIYQNVTLFFSETNSILAQLGLTIDPSCTYVGVTLKGSLEYYNELGMGGRFWLQSNYTDCPQDLFDFRDTNCDIKTAIVESPYLFTDSRTKLRIGFYDYGTLFGYPSGAIQEINFQFVGWRIDNKGTLSTGLPVKVISNDESNQ